MIFTSGSHTAKERGEPVTVRFIPYLLLFSQPDLSFPSPEISSRALRRLLILCRTKHSFHLVSLLILSFNIHTVFFGSSFWGPTLPFVAFASISKSLWSSLFFLYTSCQLNFSSPKKVNRSFTTSELNSVHTLSIRTN